MSLDSFLHTNENYGPDVNKGVSLPLSLLTELYSDINSEPIRPPLPSTLGASRCACVVLRYRYFCV